MFVPAPLALGWALAGVVYLVGTFVAVLAPDVGAAMEVAYFLPFVAEVAVAVCLVTRRVEDDLAHHVPQVAVAA